jgi:putative chitinase
MITAAQWLRVLAYCGVRYTTAISWARVFEDRVQADKFSKGAAELDDFVGQVLHETDHLESLEENLNYSAKRLMEVWPARFPTLDIAQQYAYNPEALANKTYGGRLGNTDPGDGWRFKGRGIPMITGRDNYALVADLTGLPLLDYPELLSSPDGAMQCGVLWWEKRVPDSAIDSVERVTRAVQGGHLGLAARAQLTEKASRALSLVA